MNRLKNHRLKKRRILSVMIIFLAFPFPNYATPPSNEPETSGSFVFYFANNSSLLMRDYETNLTTFDGLDRMLRIPETVSALDSIIIVGSASTIGDYSVNIRLSYERAAALRTYIHWKHPQVDRSRIFLLPSVFNWDSLTEWAEQNPFVPYREELLQILGSSVGDEKKLSRIKLLGNGATENYITIYFSKYMRSATSVLFYLKKRADAPMPPAADEVLPESTPVCEEVPVQEMPDAFTDDIEEGSPAPSFSYRGSGGYEYKPLFAVKTNLLYDAASALNIEFEIPVGKRWSVAGEWIFPWWVWEKKQYALEMMNGNAEVRYWFGKRTEENIMRGWFAGVYGGGGLYDVEWKTEGYQGEFFSAGLTGGFAHKISRYWRMEYSLGVGYIGSRYRKYVPQYGADNEWHLIRQESGKFKWGGPTRAKISLVWMLHYKSQTKKGGGQ